MDKISKISSKKKVIIILVSILCAVSIGVSLYSISHNTEEMYFTTSSINIETEEDGNKVTYMLSEHTVVRGKIINKEDNKSVLVIDIDGIQATHTFDTDKCPVISSSSISTYKLKENVEYYDFSTGYAATLLKDDIVYGEFINGNEIWVIDKNGGTGWVNTNELELIKSYNNAISFYESDSLAEYIKQF